MASNPPPEEKKLGSFNYSSESTKRRKRTVFAKDQINILKSYFQNNPYPGIEEREELSRMTNIPEDRIHVWFQNRRARQSAQQKKQTSEVSTSLGQTCVGDVSPDPILEEDFFEQKLAMPDTPNCPSWLAEPSQEAGPKCSCSFEGRAASATEAACLCGYNVSQSHPFFPSQTLRPSTELQSCAVPRPMSQRSSSQCASSLTLQGAQEPENFNTYPSFYGEIKPPLHIQDQGWTVKHVYSEDHSWPFRCAEEPSHQLQQPYPHKPSALQPLVPQEQQLSFQDQKLPPPLVKEEKQSFELFCSFNQQELHPIDASRRPVGIGSTLLPDPQGHLGDPLRDLADDQGYLTDTQGHLADPISNLADILGDLD